MQTTPTKAAPEPAPPAEDDAPGAFMDVLSRADAEAQAAEAKAQAVLTHPGKPPCRNAE